MKDASPNQKPIQRQSSDITQRASAGPDGMAIAPPQNHTGLPDQLKAGIEGMSGLAMDDVRVHYNSPRPAGLQALAYTQGTDIHVAPGQERHLPHEAWHVVQQKQGRVAPTMQLKGAQINDDRGLEKEADRMGLLALRNTDTQAAGSKRNVAPWHVHGSRLPAAQDNSQQSQPGYLLQRVIQRATYSDKWSNQYETETFAVNRERTKKVEAVIHPTNTTGRGSAPPAIALYDPTTTSYGYFLGYDGGHVLGLSLGGADQSYNVVPMLPKFNRDTWRNVENQVENAALYGHSGQDFHIVITVDYADNTRRIPESLTVKGFADVPITKKVKGKAKRVPTGKVEKDKEVLSITKTQPDDILTTPAPTDSESKTFLGQTPKPSTVLNKLKKRNDYTSDDFLQYIAKNGNLPVSNKTDYPDNPAKRPYEYLDILTLSNQVYSDANFAPRKEFSSLQRELILKFNMAQNGGKLVSDDPTDPHQNLDERGAANFPEVDHIIPKSQGGSNFFSNARLVSWQLNNKEDRVKDIAPLIALDRISYPALTGKEDPDELLTKGVLIIKKWLGETSKDEFSPTDAIIAMKLKTALLDKTAESLAIDVLAKLATDGFIKKTGPKKYEVQ